MAQHSNVQPKQVKAVATVVTASKELDELVADELSKAKASKEKNATLGELLSGSDKTRSTDEGSDKDE